ncbi:hypothetical protein IWX78_001955 [Mycetocola sp. CAN_C7]|uniref:hypothetical protein n=1 Tax=Mycetocola sp. CAN_C7 TaxID=2787724 RepID=UPI0018CB5133
MEMNTVGYSVDVDPALWVPVPLEFPTNEWPNAQVWAETTVRSLMTDMEIPDELHGDLERLALSIAASDSPLPGAEGRFWYFPVTGGMMQIAHLYASTRDAVDDLTLVEVAVGGRDEPEPQRADSVQFAGFDDAWRVVLLGTLPGDDEQVPVGHIRFIGEAKGIIVMLDVTGTDLAVLGVMESHLASLFASIRIGTAAELTSPNVGTSAH